MLNFLTNLIFNTASPQSITYYFNFYLTTNCISNIISKFTVTTIKITAIFLNMDFTFKRKQIEIILYKDLLKVLF